MRSVLLLAILATACQGANILMLGPMPTKSHYHLFDKLAIQLTKRGHSVTLLAPFKQTRAVPNLTEITVENVYEELMSQFEDKSKEKNILSKQIPVWKGIFVLPTMGQLLAEKLLGTPSLKKFMEKDQKFDVLISENFLIESATAAFALRYRVPIIAVSGFIPNIWSNILVGNPAPTSFVPDPMLDKTGKMNFVERFTNTVFYYIQLLNLHYFHLPAQDAILKKYMGSDVPYILDIVKNTSLVLANHHFSLGHPRPNVPNLIEIGGYHVPPVGQLPQDLKKILDNAKQGAILFSMGSHLKSNEMPKKMIDDILKAFSRFKQTILWKFEDDTLKNLPENVIIRKWLPQSDILAHPNLKLFVTHGGLLSTVEAIYNGVPLVGIPVFGDQPINMKYASQMGIAVTVPIVELNQDNLYAAITEVLSNPKYAENMRKRSELVRDRPMTPMDTAVYWIEYVIRHKGAPHLRSPAQDLTWYQVHLLDVFAAVFVFLIAFVSIILFFVRFLRNVLCGTSTGNKTVKAVPSSKKGN